MIINRNRGGILPSGTKQITENGTYDVTQFASANVNVSGLRFADVTDYISAYTNKISAKEFASEFVGSDKFVSIVAQDTIQEGTPYGLIGLGFVIISSGSTVYQQFVACKRYDASGVLDIREELNLSNISVYPVYGHHYKVSKTIDF